MLDGVAVIHTTNLSPRGKCALPGLLLTDRAFATSRSKCSLDDSSRHRQRPSYHLAFHFRANITISFRAHTRSLLQKSAVSTRVPALACTVLGCIKSIFGAVTKTGVAPYRTSQVSSTPKPNQLYSHNRVPSHEFVCAAFVITSQ